MNANVTRRIDLKPINEIVAGIRATAKRDVEDYARRTMVCAEADIAAVDMNRQAIALLDGAGFNLDISSYSRGVTVSLDLGFFPANKKASKALADQVRAARLALGCAIKPCHKSVAEDGKGIKFTLQAEAFPGIKVTFSRRLPKPRKGTDKKLKCRIVTVRPKPYKTLVCE